MYFAAKLHIIPVDDGVTYNFCYRTFWIIGQFLSVVCFFPPSLICFIIELKFFPHFKSIKLFHDFVYESWSKSSLLQSQAKAATSCK